MEHHDPSAHANYLIVLLAIGFALERWVPTPRTSEVEAVVRAVRGLERWLTRRVPLLRGRSKAWCELAWIVIALVARMALFVIADALRSA